MTLPPTPTDEAPATPPPPLASYLAVLDAEARAADAREETHRKAAAERAQALATERAHAYRRLDFMATLAEAAGTSPSADEAVVAVHAHVRARFGWDEDSPARAEVLAYLEPVARALHGAARPPAEGTRAADASGAAALTEPSGDPVEELAAFEAWYARSRGTPFWLLFEHYIPQTPLVDF